MYTPKHNTMKKLILSFTFILFASFSILNAQSSAKEMHSFKAEMNQMKKEIKSIVKFCVIFSEKCQQETLVKIETMHAVSDTDKLVLADKTGDDKPQLIKSAEGFYFLNNFYYNLPPEIAIPDISNSYEEYKRYLESLELMQESEVDGVIIIEMEKKVEPVKSKMDSKPESNLSNMPNFPVEAESILKDGQLSKDQFLFLDKVYENLPEEEIAPTRKSL